MGKKGLAIGAVLLLALVLFLWREMNASEPVVAIKPREPAPEELGRSPTADAVAAVQAEQGAGMVAPLKPAAPPEPGKPAKLDPRTDEFFYKFDELVPKVVTRNAAKCYEGRQGQLHRNQKLSLEYKVKVVDGEVSVTNVRIKESTLNDPALETCFIQQVQRSAWKDDELPDVEVDDMVVLRPERGMKKYWQSNIDYVGDEAPPL